MDKIAHCHSQLTAPVFRAGCLRTKTPDKGTNFSSGARERGGENQAKPVRGPRRDLFQATRREGGDDGNFIKDYRRGDIGWNLT